MMRKVRGCEGCEGAGKKGGEEGRARLAQPPVAPLWRARLGRHHHKPCGLGARGVPLDLGVEPRADAVVLERRRGGQQLYEVAPGRRPGSEWGLGSGPGLEPGSEWGWESGSGPGLGRYWGWNWCWGRERGWCSEGGHQGGDTPPSTRCSPGCPRGKPQPKLPPFRASAWPHFCSGASLLPLLLPPLLAAGSSPLPAPLVHTHSSSGGAGGAAPPPRRRGCGAPRRLPWRWAVTMAAATTPWSLCRATATYTSPTTLLRLQLVTSVVDCAAEVGTPLAEDTVRVRCEVGGGDCSL